MFIGLLKKLFILLFCVYSVIATVLYFLQELLIFPKLNENILGISNYDSVPEGIEQFFVETRDGEKLDVWTSLKPGEKTQHAAIVFHGNGETVAKGNFIPFFRQLGIPAFIFDYRGYGKSSGWPSEQGLYVDAETVYQEVLRRTSLPASNLILLGNSIGTGPASYLAQKINPKALLLIAPYSDFPSLINDKPAYAAFSFLLRYELPVATYVSQLRRSCVIIAHGKQDLIIPYTHSVKIVSLLDFGVSSSLLHSEAAGHNDIFFKVENELAAEVKRCLGSA
jgi:fermentation-respiration switch protein FrsA (DUF1100 family)